MISLEDISFTNWVVIGSAITALYKYINYNEGEDKLELNLDLKMLDANLLEINLKIENKGKVKAKIPMKNLTYKLKYYKHSDIHDNDDVFNRLKKYDNTFVHQFLETKDKDDYTWIYGETTQNYTEYIKIFTPDIFYIECIVKLDYSNKEKDWQSCRKILEIKQKEIIDNNLNKQL